MENNRLWLMLEDGPLFWNHSKDTKGSLIEEAILDTFMMDFSSALPNYPTKYLVNFARMDIFLLF